jgi:hypothetical protein
MCDHLKQVWDCRLMPWQSAAVAGMVKQDVCEVSRSEELVEQWSSKVWLWSSSDGINYMVVAWQVSAEPQASTFFLL